MAVVLGTWPVMRMLEGEQPGAVSAELPTAERVVEAASIKSGFPMSHADAFAAATAVAHDAELWTGDPELLVPGAPELWTGDPELLVPGAPWRWRDLRMLPLPERARQSGVGRACTAAPRLEL